MPNLPNQDEERRSYAGTFALCAGALFAIALWSLVDELFLRRPWKKYQAELSWREIESTEAAIAEGEQALQGDPEYQQLVADLRAAQESLRRGEKAAQRQELEGKIGRAQVRLGEFDQELRFVKSEIEEARYHYDHALHAGQPTDEALAHVTELERHKAEAETKLAAAQAEVTGLEKQLSALQDDVARLADAIDERRAEVEKFYQRLDSITATNMRFDVPLFGPVSLRMPPVPNIKQVVLEEFDRSKFDTPLARVDRCESCHAAINKKGYDDAPNPLKTHPDREVLLGKHPPEKFGCTACHHGQGAAVNSPEMAHGEVKFWEHPLRRDEMVEASCIQCHLDVQSLPHAGTISRGERLFTQLGCHGCHLTEGYDGLPKAGPSLRRISAKLDRSWMVRWIQNPHAIRPRTRMPNFQFDEDQAISIAAYLLNASQGESAEWLEQHPLPLLEANEGDVSRGKELVESLGCRGCHVFAPGEDAPGVLGENKDLAPNLAEIAAKVGPQWTYHWIRNPRGYSPVARMPNLRLTDDEARAITAYLMTLGKPGAPIAGLDEHLAASERVAAGEKIVRKYGCFGCHDIPGMENESRIGVELSSFSEKILEELFFGDATEIPRTWDDWTYNKLKEPRIYATKWIEQLMPNFELADADIEALRVFLASRTDAEIPERYRFHDHGRSERIVAGRRLIWRYNCTGCHIIEDKGGDIRVHYEGREALAPPNLHGEGAKVQSPWLFGFLKEPVPIRPWLHVRMPTFGFSDSEANRVLAFFNSLDRVEIPYVFFDPHAVPPEYITAAETLMAPDYYNCWSCHQQGDRKPEGPPEGWAPDLAMAHERLKPEWLIEWIRDPQVVMPGTKMPSFYPDGPPDILGGDDEVQITALRDYILTLGNGQRSR
jgi:cytochrome c1